MVHAADLQGNVLRGYSHSHACFLFVALPPAAAGRRFLAGLLPEVTTSARWDPGSRPPSTLNVALTAAGLVALGVPVDVVAGFPEDFRQGMAARGSSLRDAAADLSPSWEPAWQRSAEMHALLSVYADDEDELAARRRDLLDRLRSAGGWTVAEESGCRLTDDRGRSIEHFGFVDGLSQPHLEAAAQLESGILDPDRPVLADGEVLLGRIDGEGFEATYPGPAAFGRDGTFLVFRKLAQDVAAFRRLCADQGTAYPGGPDEFAAKLMGRRPNGRHLGPSADTAAEPTFDDDREGGVCPIGSHIRRANPRRSSGPERQAFFDRHRMLRRGMTYGPPAGDEPDRSDRGLLFVCLCASIGRQFEFVQAEWLNDGNALGIGDEKDPITASRAADDAGRMTIQGSDGRPPWIAAPVPRLVTVRGGAYLFLPSVTALRWLTSAGWSGADLVVVYAGSA